MVRHTAPSRLLLKASQTLVEPVLTANRTRRVDLARFGLPKCVVAGSLLLFNPLRFNLMEENDHLPKIMVEDFPFDFLL